MTGASLHAPLDGRGSAPVADDFRAIFFDCRFVYAADELIGDEPCAIFEDEGSDPFFRTLIEACRPGSPPQVLTLEALAQFDGPVFVEAPVWQRCCRKLAAVGVRGERVRAFLYFECDPSGFWDFAKACGPALAELVRTRRLNGAALAALAPFLETWLAGRVQGRRLTTDAGFATRDFTDLIAANGAKISRVLSKLSDDASRAHYARIVYGGAEDILREFSANVFGRQQYMEIAHVSSGDVIANFGVGSGWELPYFLCRMRGQGRIHNFDPNIVYPGTVYGPLIAEFANIVTDHRLIVTDHDGTMDLSISHAGMIRSADAPGAAETVSYTARSLDSLVAEGMLDHIDYMKMDVEGGEIFILKGAMETIRRLRPKLAVAIYHEPEHFWDYPLFLMDRLENYRFYVRQYGYSRFETLLYAVPMEDCDSRSGDEGFAASAETGRVADGLVGFYAYDQAPRSMYSGPRRVATRFFGSAWSLGDLSSAPRIEADQLCAVFEGGDRRLFATRHRYSDGRTNLVCGVATSAIKIDWTAALGIDETSICVAVANHPAGAAIAIYDHVRRRATLAIVTAESISLDLEFACAEEPVIVVFDQDGGGFSVITTSNDRRTLSRRRYDRRGGGPGEAVSAKLPRPLRGAVLHKRFVEARAEHAFAFALGEAAGDQIDLVRFNAAGLSSLGGLDVGQGIDIVPLVPLVGAPGP